MTDRVFVALGSNLGDRWSYLRLGLGYLPELLSVSSVYQTPPVGGPPGQGAYLNMVAELAPPQDAWALLDLARQAEDAAGRQRGPHWGPRTLDVDVLVVGRQVVAAQELVVPHPRMWQRGFVLVPLAELAPELVGERLTPELAEGITLAGTI